MNKKIFVKCDVCLNYEHLPVEEQLNHAQSFHYLPQQDFFICETCGNIVDEYEEIECD